MFQFELWSRSQTLNIIHIDPPSPIFDKRDWRKSENEMRFLTIYVFISFCLVNFRAHCWESIIPTALLSLSCTVFFTHLWKFIIFLSIFKKRQIANDDGLIPIESVTQKSEFILGNHKRFEKKTFWCSFDYFDSQVDVSTSSTCIVRVSMEITRV